MNIPRNWSNSQDHDKPIDLLLSTDSNHQGLLLHSIYNRPQGWGYSFSDEKTSRGESSMWGDYHFLEPALYIYRLIKKWSTTHFLPVFNEPLELSKLAKIIITHQTFKHFR